MEKVERLRNYDDLVRCIPWELFAALFFLVCGLMTQSAQAQSQEDNPPEANPSRPTVSTPATLTPAGYLQFESGFTGAANSREFSSRYSLNEVMKLSVIKRLELLASAEPIGPSVLAAAVCTKAKWPPVRAISTNAKAVIGLMAR